MKVFREVKMNVSRYEVGDKIKVKIINANGKTEKHFATAIRLVGDEVEFILDECLDDRVVYNSNGSTEGGYEKSELRNDILKKMMCDSHKLIPNEDGDVFYLLSLREVCGCDENFNDCDGQIEFFKDRKNRIGYSYNDEYVSWWLRDVVSASGFAYVFSNGFASNSNASGSYGIRPAFRMKNR